MRDIIRHVGHRPSEHPQQRAPHADSTRQEHVILRSPRPPQLRRPRESLHFLASAICERVGLDNVVIVGDAGLALGAAVEGQDAIALAAYAQIIAETQSTQERTMLYLKLAEWIPGAGANRISVRRLTLFR